MYGKLYVEYLKVGFKSVRNFIGGTFYTNKLGINKFFPFSNETSAENGRTIRGFIDLFGLPPKPHSDNHKNFKEVISKATPTEVWNNNNIYRTSLAFT